MGLMYWEGILVKILAIHFTVLVSPRVSFLIVEWNLMNFSCSKLVYPKLARTDHIHCKKLGKIFGLKVLRLILNTSKIFVSQIITSVLRFHNTGDRFCWTLACKRSTKTIFCMKCLMTGIVG